MKILKIFLRILAVLLAVMVLTVGFLGFYLTNSTFGFAHALPEDEMSRRMDFVYLAKAYEGIPEGNIAHHGIIDTYNSHAPLAQGYEVQYDDDWCATFVSFAAIEVGMTDIIPTECSCERQIGLWMELDRWEERDSYLPLPGDIIYYDWDVRTLGNSTGWSDHVGIVVGTHGPFIKVIEGNKDDAVGYRYIIRWDPRIRGYGLPNYS